jgi:hypothetical protein
MRFPDRGPFVRAKRFMSSTKIGVLWLQADTRFRPDQYSALGGTLQNKTIRGNSRRDAALAS